MSTPNLEDELELETATRLLSALSHDYDRGVVRYFRESTDDTASLYELAENVADHRTEGTPDSSERVATRLHHVGLPKLADAGVVDYDQRSKTVRCWDHPLVEGEALGSLVGEQ